jgi:hypothetical protein
MSENIKKLGIVSVALLVVSLLGIVVYQQVQFSKKQVEMEKNVVLQKQLVDGIVRHQQELVSLKDLNELAKSLDLNMKAIQADMKKLNADVVGINTFTAISEGRKETGVGTYVPVPSAKLPEVKCPANGICPSVDPYNHYGLKRSYEITEKFKDVVVPFGTVSFEAGRSPDFWTLETRERKYTSSTVIGLDEQQRLYGYSQFTIDVDGKSYKVNVNTASLKQVYPDPKMSWWNPNLFIGLDTGLNLSAMQADFSPTLNVGLMSYGKFVRSPEWSILQVGVGYSTSQKALNFVLTPVAINMGQWLPSVSNTYLAPSMHVSTHGDISAMLGIRVSL